jgi:DDE superfamily endonuclease
LNTRAARLAARLAPSGLAFPSGKYRKHGMNLQVIASLGGDIVWVSGALPGSVHDKEAESAPRGALLYSRFSREESGGYSWV